MTTSFALRFAWQVSADLGKVVALVLGVVAILAIPLLILIASTGTPVEFQSSDGGFHAGEDHWGDSATFADIQTAFEDYVRRCNARGVRLGRLTPKPGLLSLTRFFDDFHEAKWQVPLISVTGQAEGARTPDGQRCSQMVSK